MGLSRGQVTLSDKIGEACDETEALITVMATQTGESKMMADMLTMASPAAPAAAPKKKAKKKAATKKKAAKKKAAPKKKAAKKKPAKRRAAKKAVVAAPEVMD